MNRPRLDRTVIDALARGEPPDVLDGVTAGTDTEEAIVSMAQEIQEYRDATRRRVDCVMGVMGDLRPGPERKK